MQLRALRWLSAHQVAVWSVVALSTMGIWMNLAGYSTAFAPPLATAQDSLSASDESLAFFCGLILSGLVFIVLDRRIPPLKTYLDIGMGVLMCLGTASFGIAWSQALFNPWLLAIGGCVCSGLGYAWFVRSFYIQLALKEPLRVAIVAIALSLLVETIASMLISLTQADSIQILISVSVPPVVCLMSVALAARTRKAALVEAKLSGKPERYQMTILVITVFSMLVIRATTTVGLWGNARESYQGQQLADILISLGSCLIFFVIAYLALIRRSAMPLQTRYQAPLLILVAGCILYLLNALVLPLPPNPLEDIVQSAIEMFGHLILWTVVVASIKSLRFSCYRIVGFTAILYAVLAIVWTSFLKDTQIVPLLVILLVYGMAVLLATAPLKAREPHENGPDDAVYAKVAARFGLTAREGEVLMLLVHGRSRPYIQERLHIADGTAKTHTTHIYAKMGVHTRQELLDIIDEARAEA
ncbi:MAG: helix-turn-helix transcriptional regulator [Coriobacteriaceae bacterium]|jgi:DNA-binding CsgD family transcriptional regulator|nr:helix-turn-helix transcriptional regulator [Coriobacteriaceae bacterium]